VPDVSWLQDQLTQLWNAVNSEAALISQNNGDAVALQSQVAQIMDPTDRATAQSALDTWVSNQSLLAQGYRKFKEYFDAAWDQAKAFLQAAQLPFPSGLSGVPVASGLGDPVIITTVAVAAVTVAGAAYLIVHEFNQTQRQHLTDLKSLFDGMITNNATPDQIATVLNAYNTSVQKQKNDNPDLFGMVAEGLQIFVIVGAVVLLWPQLSSLFKKGLRRVAA